MRILVTGGAGFIGSHLVEKLLAAGHAVRVLDNLSTGRRENLPHGVELQVADIRDPAAVAAGTREVDAIAHLAAVASVQASVDDPVGTHGSNFLGTLNLLESARERSIRRFVYASSAAVYGNTVELPVPEDRILTPLTPYAADKLAGEHYLDFYSREHGLEGVPFRFFNIYGPRQDPSSPYSGVISIFADRARAGRGVKVFGDGEQSRDFVYVADLVAILAQALTAPQSPECRPTNVGTGTSSSLLDLLAALESLVGENIPREHLAPRAGDIRHSLADVGRLHQRFGRVPDTALEQGLAALLAHDRA